jgi:hypothetical protein
MALKADTGCGPIICDRSGDLLCRTRVESGAFITLPLSRSGANRAGLAKASAKDGRPCAIVGHNCSSWAAGAAIACPEKAQSMKPLGRGG